MKVCPDCKTTYSDDFEECESCEVPLLDAPESLPQNPELADVVEVAPDEETAMVDLEAMEDQLRARAAERADEEAEAAAQQRRDDDPDETGTVNLSELQRRAGGTQEGPDERDPTQLTSAVERTLAGLPPEEQDDEPSRAPVFIAAGLVAVVALAGVAVALWVLFAQGAPVSISSIPAGAQVLVDGKELGLAPIVTKVRRGTHTLELRLQGHEPFKEVVDVGPDGLNLAQELKELKPDPPPDPVPVEPVDPPPDTPSMTAAERDAAFTAILKLIEDGELDAAFTAIKDFVKADPEDPRGDQLFDALAKARTDKRRPKSTELSAKAKLARADALAAEGDSLYAARRMGEARMKLLQALQYNPKLAGPHRVLARIYLAQGNEKRVRYHLQRYLRLGGRDPDRAVRRWLEDHPAPKK